MSQRQVLFRSVHHVIEESQLKKFQKSVVVIMMNMTMIMMRIKFDLTAKKQMIELLRQNKVCPEHQPEP